MHMRMAKEINELVAQVWHMFSNHLCTQTQIRMLAWFTLSVVESSQEVQVKSPFKTPHWNGSVIVSVVLQNISKYVLKCMFFSKMKC